MKKLMIEVRVNEYMMRDSNKNVPWTAEELGRTAGEIRAAGASIIHFHARGPEGRPGTRRRVTRRQCVPYAPTPIS